MNTYRTNECLERLSAYLVSMKKPFIFDGYSIEFTAGDLFMNLLREDDRRLAKVKFEII